MFVWDEKFSFAHIFHMLTHIQMQNIRKLLFVNNFVNPN